ncbi:MAG: hypothetical protein IH931_01220 [candidate division Zixibacteria bacterium]|nr:hypothetical protein [candidate division Zixibacteria bacterium]
MTFRMPMRFITAFCFSILIWSATEAQVSSGIPTITSYFELLVTGNSESAGLIWTQAAQERSTRFGIKYADIPLKSDAASPIVQNLELMRHYLQPPVKSYEDLFDGAYQKLHYLAIVEGKKVEHTYYAEFDGRNYWLTYPQDIYSRDWPVLETEYFRIHVHPDVQKFINTINLEEADKFVERMIDSLELGDYDIRHLGSVKIEYFYCNSDKTVKTITGRRTKGIYDKASSDIISSFFPHYHEIVHLLTDYKMRSLPLFVHPLFEEGLAVYMGGRWGKSMAALSPLGIFLYKEGITPLDSLLAYSSFKSNAESDLAYPLAGIFTRFLIERIGHTRYLALYRKMSGSFDQVSAMPVDSVKARVLRALDISGWDKFAEIFDKYISELQSKHQLGRPGTTESGSVTVSVNGIKVKETDDWLSFEIDTKIAGTSKGTLFFGRDEKLKEAVSVMFSEHFPERESLGGYRYAIRFDSNEAGVYDYATSHLLGKIINSLAPSPEYYNEESHILAFRFRKSLTNGVSPSNDDYKFIAE